MKEFSLKPEMRQAYLLTPLLYNIACEIIVGARERNTMGANRKGKSQIILVCRCYDSILLPEVSEI